MSKNPLFIAFVLWTLLITSSAQAQTAQPTAQGAAASTTLTGPTLEDGTPVKLRIGRTVSSADAHVGDTIDFEVLEEVRVGNLLVIPKGGTAWATVTEVKAKGHMGKGGKLDINIDSVRLVDGEKAALRAVKDVKGGSHTGAMTGAIVATSLVFFPAAPFFLFMHGKDISIPKGTEVTAYVNGNFPVDMAKFQPATGGVLTGTGAATELNLSSTPAGAEVSIDGNFVGNTPSTLNMTAGDHAISVKMAGFQPWERTIHTSGGKVNLTANLVKTGTSPSYALPQTNVSAPASNPADPPVQQQPTTQQGPTTVVIPQNGEESLGAAAKRVRQLEECKKLAQDNPSITCQ